MCPGSDNPEISVSSSDNYRSPFHPEAVTSVSAATPPTPTDLQISSPNEDRRKESHLLDCCASVVIAMLLNTIKLMNLNKAIQFG